MDAEAIGTRLSFDGHTITIERISGISKTVYGETTLTIPIEQINSVEWKQPTWAGAGHIRFAIAGSQASATKTAPNRDQNTVLFGKRQRKAFETIRYAVQAAISR